MITITDPEGFPINLIHGQTPAEPGPLPSKLTINDVLSAPRKREFQRFKAGPAAIHKLGHYGLCVTDFPAQVDFYTKHFNLVPTDILYVDEAGAVNPTMTGGEGCPRPKDTKEVAIFCHVDRGQEFVDHHTFFMSANRTGHVHHASFEVHDLDTQQLGHQWLASKGYESVWGVGRHILGSQSEFVDCAFVSVFRGSLLILEVVFDYWWDVHRNMIEVCWCGSRRYWLEADME
jgi:hypothetical protein